METKIEEISAQEDVREMLRAESLCMTVVLPRCVVAIYTKPCPLVSVPLLSPHDRVPSCDPTRSGARTNMANARPWAWRPSMIASSLARTAATLALLLLMREPILGDVQGAFEP